MSARPAARLATLVVTTSAATFLSQHLLASGAAADDPAQPASAAGYELTGGRAGTGALALLALIGVALGAAAVVRSRGRRGSGTGLRSARVACAAGLVSLVAGGFVVATADGGVGAGEGTSGAVAAAALGLVALGLGGRAITRARPEPTPSRPPGVRR